MTLPPGPRGAWWQTLCYVRNPLRFYLRCAAQYDGLFTAPTILGPLVVVSRPEHVRTLFALPPSDFGRWSVAAVQPLLGASAVLLTDGERHLQQRRMMAPAFHRERVYGHADTLEMLTRRHVATWPQQQEFQLQERLIDLAIDIILSVVLGVPEARRQPLRMAMRNTLASIGPWLMLARAMSERTTRFGPYARFLQARRQLDDLLLAEIDQSTAAAPTVLGVLQGMRDEHGQPFSREELRDQVMTLLFAGHETSAIALSWAIYWLHRHPAVLQTLRRELADIDCRHTATLLALPYLDAVCHEALRLHPTVPEVIRQLKVPLALEGFALPAGTPVAACIVATHHRPELYPQPERFWPERFLQRRYAAHEYYPFGGGVHRCLGESLAWMEMKVLLATLLQTCRFELAGRGPTSPVLRSITMAPRDGIPVRVTTRADL